MTIRSAYYLTQGREVPMHRGNSKGGFTIVELVVAMSIIFIVSAVAIGIINTQNDYHRRTAQTVEATNMAENAIECFRYTDNRDDFDGAFAATFTDKTLPMNLYHFQISGMDITLTFDYNPDTDTDTLTFFAKDIKSEEIILEQSYTK